MRRKLLVLLPAVAVIAVLLACQMPPQAAPAAAPPATTATTATTAPPQPPASNPPATASTDTNVAPPTAPPKDLDVARRISVADALKAIQNNTAILVDVRGQQQWEEGHAKNALHIPESEIVSRLSELPKNKLIITYCS
jgi:Rhodanese-like domain